MRPIFEFSAGILLLNKNDILLIKTRSRRDHAVWTFPKGKIEQNESPYETAIRELKEETGYGCINPIPAGITSYIYNSKQGTVLKKIYWYSAEPAGMDKLSDPQVEEIGWMSYSRAFESLEHNADKILLKHIF